MSISKIFIPNFVCVLTNERYKTYQRGFLCCGLGHAPGVGLGVLGGVKNFSVGICNGAISTAHSSLLLRITLRKTNTKVCHLLKQ